MNEQQKIETAGVAEAEAVDLNEFSELLEKDFRVKKDKCIGWTRARSFDSGQLCHPGGCCWSWRDHCNLRQEGEHQYHRW